MMKIETARGGDQLAGASGGACDHLGANRATSASQSMNTATSGSQCGFHSDTTWSSAIVSTMKNRPAAARTSGRRTKMHATIGASCEIKLRTAAVRYFH